jgi:NAD(P)H dehydrogenase (quinone)
MHALLVLAPPNKSSLTHSVAAQIANGLASSNSDQSFEIADLAAEGFDPRFTATDIAVQLREVPPSADVIAEQARIDRADTLVLVYPIYWWSMPALLKGWIDRVFTNGWAYDEDPNGKIEKKLGHLHVHLVAIGGADERTYARPWLLRRDEDADRSRNFRLLRCTSRDIRTLDGIGGAERELSSEDRTSYRSKSLQARVSRAKQRELQQALTFAPVIAVGA